MATPEERKARLQATRRSQPQSGFDFSRGDTGVGQTNTQEERRRSNMLSNRLQGLQTTSPIPPQRGPSTQNRTLKSIDAQAEKDRDEKIGDLLASTRVRQAMARRQALAGEQANITSKKSQQAAGSQSDLKKKATAGFKRGVLYIVSLLAAAFDLGSSGVSFIIDIFVYTFTLGWLNLEMIYGGWIMKGKSRYVSPLSWDPIPMPIDKNAVLLSIVVIAADLAFGVAVIGLGVGGACLLHDTVKITTSTSTEAIVIGSSIAQGQSGGLCLGGIIASILSL